MARRMLVSTKFELCLLQAKHVYMLDACADNGVVYDTAQYLATKKNAPVTWVKNTHLRQSNRKVKAVICTQPKLERQLRAKATAHVITLLRQGKRVVVSSSTKGFTEKLEAAIKAAVPGKRVLVHNSESDRSLLRDPSTLWPGYDAVIYSPTITAGVSFEREHFDQLVAYIENSFATPSVDLALQQLFRVRQLQEGDMTLFVNNTLRLAGEDYPVCTEKIEAWLDQNVACLHRYYPDDALSYESNTVVRDGRIRYDTTLMSYRILTGIVSNRNRSLTHFCPILLGTLAQDYGIPVTREFLMEDEKDELKWVMQLQAGLEAANKDAAEAEFTKDMIPTPALYAVLRDKEARGEAMTTEERNSKWICDAIRLWGVDPDVVDAAFYNTYIGPFTMANRRAIFNLHYAARRMAMAAVNNVEDNRGELVRFLGSMGKDGTDTNINLYKTKVITFYRRLINAQGVLTAVLPTGYDVSAFLKGEGVEMAAEELNARLTQFLTDMDDAGFKEFLAALDMKPAVYPGRTKVMEDSTKMLFLAKGALGALGLDLETTSRGTQNKARTGFGTGAKKCIHCPQWSSLAIKYKGKLFHNILDHYRSDAVDR